MSGNTVLITGATGFIGSHLVRYLLKHREYFLVAIARKSPRADTLARHLGNRGRVIYGNFYESGPLDEAFTTYEISKIIHIAALRGAGAGAERLYETVNVQGTRRLLTQAMLHKVDQFVFCSSVGVYGTIPEELPAGLNTTFHGDNAYHRSKIQAEELVMQSMDNGLPACIVRPAITYGTGDSKGFPLTLIKLTRQGRLPLPGRETLVHLLAVGSLVELFTLLLEYQGRKRIFIAADSAPIPLRELVDLIALYYHNVPYSAPVTIPEHIATLMIWIAGIVHSSSWKTRLQLLCSSWYYSIDSLEELPGFRPKNTQEQFLRFLQVMP